jgi:hypothetical protein
VKNNKDSTGKTARNLTQIDHPYLHYVNPPDPQSVKAKDGYSYFTVQVKKISNLYES